MNKKKETNKNKKIAKVVTKKIKKTLGKDSTRGIKTSHDDDGFIIEIGPMFSKAEIETKITGEYR